MKVLSLLTLATTLVLVTACGDKDDKGSNLGGDAAENQKVFGNIVAGMESPAMLFRLGVDQIIRKSGLLKNDETSMMLERGMQMLKAADLKQPVRVAVDFKSKEDMWIVATLGVENGADFKKLIQSVAKIGEDKNGMSTAVVNEKDVKVMMRFNDNICIAIVTDPRRSEADFEAYMEKVVESAGKEGSLDPAFTKFIEGTEDLAFAYNFDPVMSLIPQEDMDDATKQMLPHLKGMHANASANFENGAFVVSMDADMSKSPELAKFIGDGLPADYGAYLAHKTFYGYFGIDMGLDAMVSFAKTFNQDQTHEMGEISPDQLVEIFTGEAAFAIMKLDGLAESILEDDEPDVMIDDNFDALNDRDVSESVAEEVDIKSKDNDMEDFLAIVGVKNVDALKTFMESSGKLTREGDLYVTENGTRLLVKDNKLFATNSADVLAAVKSGNMAKSAAAEALQVNPMSLYVDFKTIYADLQSLLDSDEFEGSNYLRILDNAKGFSTGSHAEFRLEFIDKNVNALEQLIMIILQDNPEMMFGSMLM